MENEHRIEQGILIAKLRKKAGYTQRQLADLTGINYANIARIEKGKYSVSMDALLKIERALGVERIYINNNNEIMGTPITLTMGANDPVAFYNEIKNYPCFKLVELSRDNTRITAIWNDHYKNENFANDEDPEMILDILICEHSDWACGVEEEYPIGKKIWWFECDL